MANKVFANMMEISCKAASGKSICAFPDVCFTPPENPATPPGVPIPYPNTGMASDCTGGSKSVKISGKEVMLRDKSSFKKSTGDEAGSAAKKGVVTSTNRGKVYFTSWSMDVKFEGQNVVRNLDMTTHNHASMPCNTPPWPYTDSMSMMASLAAECAMEVKTLETACKGQSTDDCSDACKDAQKCVLPPKGKDKEWCCKPNNTGHHMIEDHWVDGMPGFEMATGNAGYNAAPTVCVNATRSSGSDHREIHNIQGVFEESYKPKGIRHDPSQPSGGWNYGAGKNATLNAHDAVFAGSNCSRGCLSAQLDAFYGDDESRPLRTPTTQGVGRDRPATLAAWGSVLRGS